MAYKNSLLGCFVKAAVIAGAVVAIANLGKQAKEENKDILDVAKDKVKGVVDKAKSGQLKEEINQTVKDVGEKVQEVVNDVKAEIVKEDVKPEVVDEGVEKTAEEPEGENKQD